MAAMGKIELIIKLGTVDWVLPEELFSKTETVYINPHYLNKTGKTLQFEHNCTNIIFSNMPTELLL